MGYPSNKIILNTLSNSEKGNLSMLRHGTAASNEGKVESGFKFEKKSVSSFTW